VQIFRNETRRPGHWVEILPVGAGSDRTPLHARVTVSAGGRQRTQEFTIQPSYASGSYLPLHFGLGASAQVDGVEVAWPEGATQILPGPAADRAYRTSRKDGLQEGLAGPK
jgi:hypothetical protein